MNTFSPDYNENKINNILLSLSKEISSFSNLKNPSINLKKRREFFIKELEDLTFDASRHNISIKTIELSKKLFQEMKTNQFLEAMWSGKVVNITENRQAIHPALRGSRDSFFPKDIMNEVSKQKKQMLKIAEGVRNGNIKSHSGKKYTSVLAIGIGGSDLGPRMSVKALTPFKSNIDVRFVSNIDPSDLINVTADLDPSKTLIIVSSKTFTTVETLANAKAAFNWLAKNIGEIGAKNQQYAITSNFDNAKKFGFDATKILLFSEWVGGRTSIWSSVGLPLAISIGEKLFKEFLLGGYSVDKHMKNEMTNSIPSLMAVLGYIHRNQLGAGSHCIIPYDANLSYFPSYLQQLEMESNGKSVSIKGDYIKSSSVPVVWGLVGTDAQHSFFQMLHQGTDKIPLDILVARESAYADKNKDIIERHRMLVANALGQVEALHKGSKNISKHKNFDGGRSISLISYNKLTPYTLGSLIAIYEYKVIVQSTLWRVNPFDQFGVELGKKYANNLIEGNETIFTNEPNKLENFLNLK